MKAVAKNPRHGGQNVHYVRLIFFMYVQEHHIIVDDTVSHHGPFSPCLPNTFVGHSISFKGKLVIILSESI